MPTYDLGDAVTLEHDVRDADGAPTAATTAVTLTRPNGTSFGSPSVTNPELGLYRAAPIPDAVGIWAGVWSTSGTVTSVTPFTFTVADPAPPLYTSLPLVKSALSKITDDDRDELIEQAIVAASRMIDRRTGRHFYSARTASARTFPVAGRSSTVGTEQTIWVDDIATVTDLAVATGSSGSWTSVSTYETGPDNAFAYGLPITELRAAAGWLPSTGRVQVTARWGWPAIPDEIAQAALMLAARLYKRKESPNGVIGSADWGQIRVSRTDPDIEALLAPFIVPVIA